jgi:hypothetical protein
MRPLLVAAVLLALVPAGADAWEPDVRAARSWAAARQGIVSFAVRTDRHLWGADVDRAYPSASVVKAMLLVAYLREPDVRGRALRGGERALLAPMIRVSSNDAATEIRNRVGNDALVAVAHAAGMSAFQPDVVWGSCRITARDQTRFFLHIDALVPPRHRAYAMDLLRTITPAQRWGLARARPGGWTLYFKGGWGSGSGAVDHHVGLLERHGHRVAIAVLTVGSPSHGYGKATEEGVARRLLRGLAGELRGTVGRVFEAGVGP